MDAAIDIRPTYNPWGYTAQLFPVRAHVDGVGPYRLIWNQVLRIPVTPGDHVVAIWARYIFTSDYGLSHAILHVEPGCSVGLSWKMPLSLLTSGRLVCQPVGPPVALSGLEQGYVPSRPGPCMVWPPHGSEPLVPLGAVGTPPPPAGAWQPDPTGRHRLRWWDGTRWTDGVSDGTQTLSDPI